MAQSKSHTDSVTAVVVLASGAVPRLTVGTDYALTLHPVRHVPEILGQQRFLYVHQCSEPLHWHFSLETPGLTNTRQPPAKRNLQARYCNSDQEVHRLGDCRSHPPQWHRPTVCVDYVLATLAAVFPELLTNKISFMFTRD